MTEEIRNFILEKLEEERRKENIKKAEEVLRKVRRLRKRGQSQVRKGKTVTVIIDSSALVACNGNVQCGPRSWQE